MDSTMNDVTKRRRPSPPSSSPAAATEPLDDNTLRDMFLRLTSPASLVRAAFVCRQWFRVASDPAFLARFRDHRAPLLGFYVEPARLHLPVFLPMPRLPAEFAAVVRRAGTALDEFADDGEVVASLLACWNGRLLVRLHAAHDIRRAWDAVLPPHDDRFFDDDSHMLYLKNMVDSATAMAALPLSASSLRSKISKIAAFPDGAADDGGELHRRVSRRHEPACGIEAFGCDIEAQETRRVEVVEAAEEGGIGDDAEPSPADGGGADEAGWEDKTEQDLSEQVVVFKHLGSSGGGRQ